MASPLFYLERQPDDWLITPGGDRLSQWVDYYRQELQPLTQRKMYPKILLVELDPVRFLAGFLAACEEQCPIFLGNPGWTTIEQQQVIATIRPDVIWSAAPTFTNAQVMSVSTAEPAATASEYQGCILIPTGGSSGQIRFAIHTWATLMASVSGFQHYFQVKQVNSCCVLPLYHVSGFMQFLRSLTSGGKLMLLPFKSLTAATLLPDAPAPWFLSLVPTQLQRLLHDPDLTQWVAHFQTVLLGGAPAWTELLAQARQSRIRLAPTYGMTETASQVVTLKPEAFLAGHSTCGLALPHAQLLIWDDAGQPVPPSQVGTVVIQATSLALGYYPAIPTQPSIWVTDDQGFLNEQGELVIVGRSSSKIITGGENVFPEEVEALIRATGLVQDICVLGMSDRHWGEVVTAIYVPQNAQVTPERLQQMVQGQISSYKLPKRWLATHTLPRNAQGKIDRKRLRQRLIENDNEMPVMKCPVMKCQ